MKNIIKDLILCFCFVFVLASFSGCGDKNNDNDETVSLSQEDNSGEEITSSEEEETVKRPAKEYDEDSNLIRENLYNDSGELTTYKMYDYLDGKLFSVVTFDNEDRVLKEEQYDDNGEVFWWAEHQYENGRRVRINYSSGEYSAYHFDDNGNESGVTYYDGDGNITDEQNY